MKCVLFKVKQEPEIIDIKNIYNEGRKLIECDGLDSTSISDLYCEDGRFVVWVDDVGMLDNKPYNRGFYGNFIVNKVDFEGFDVDMNEIEIQRVKNALNKRNNLDEKENEFVDKLKELIGFSVKTYSKDIKGLNNIVQISSFEVIDELRDMKDLSVKALIDDMMLAYSLNDLKLDTVREMIEEVQDKLAEFRFNQIEEQI